MKHSTRWWLAATLLGLALPGLANAEIFVIANPDVQLSGDEIRDVFIGEKLLSKGLKLTPIDNSAAQAEFLSKVMSLDASKYGSIWTKKGFRDGISPPAAKPGDAEVIMLVRKTSGSIGYVTKLPGTPSALGIIVVKHFD
jgi:hypothetical protein